MLVPQGAPGLAALRDFDSAYVRSWSCKNTLAEALTRRDFGDVAMLGHLAEFGGLCAPDADYQPSWAALHRLRAHICDDYAVTAARSRWTPMMFMTRVRL